MNTQEHQTTIPDSEDGNVHPCSSISKQIQHCRPHKPSPGETVAVALSGGLDSMVTALLLQEQGYQVVAVHMLLRQDDSPPSAENVQRLADRLGVQLHKLDTRPDFYQQVIRPFLDSYSQGKTPNPCVLCNPRIKFALLHRHTAELGVKWFATGHYVRLRHDDAVGQLRLFRAQDRGKDQSYFLYGLSQAQLDRSVFPLGNLLKSEVRQIAATAGITDYHSPESQEICFIPDNDYRRFLEQHLGSALPQSGPVLDLEGRKLGEHEGIHRYTIGQRRGLGIPSSAPYYVVGLDPETNTVRVGRQHDLSSRELLVTDVNWLVTSPLSAPLQALVQVRSRHKEAPAILKPAPNGVWVRFLEQQMAIASGQAAVFYCGEEVLGGGIIHRVIS